MKRSLYGIALMLCAGGTLLFGGLFLRQWREYHAGEEAYRALTKAAAAAPSPQEHQAGQAASEQVLPQIDFELLEGMNPDVCGWLYCEDTVISYPVVQGPDNEYYLTHLFDGTANSAGCLFLDSRCDGLRGKNSVIHGHHMKNGTMFASLENYRDQAYYDAHPSLFLLTPEGTWTIRLFSAYVASADSDAWQLEFSSGEEYGRWLERLKERSAFESRLTPTPSDRVITLSTCDYSYQDAWFVCHGLVCEN